jgi:hypothetical protein
MSALQVQLPTLRAMKPTSRMGPYTLRVVRNIAALVGTVGQNEFGVAQSVLAAEGAARKKSFLNLVNPLDGIGCEFDSIAMNGPMTSVQGLVPRGKGRLAWHPIHLCRCVRYFARVLSVAQNAARMDKQARDLHWPR